jgi:hypothetical protein
MALLEALCWALIFIIRIRFPPGTSLVTILNDPRKVRKNTRQKSWQKRNRV